MKKTASVFGFWLTVGENIDFVTQYLAKNRIRGDALKSHLAYLLIMSVYGSLCWFQTSCHFAATPRGHHLLFQSCSSQQLRHFDFITERHRSRVEWNSTVCNLPPWARRQGYRSIGKMLLAACPWSSLCGKWRLRSCTNIIIIKAAMQQAAS